MYYSSYAEQTMSQFMYRVYGWMALALSLSAAVAYYIAASPAILAFVAKSPYMLIGVFVAQLALVMVLSMLLLRMSFIVAFTLFMIYAASLGISLSLLFVTYDVNSLYATFAVTAGMFGALCLYGYFTKADLTSLGTIAGMALFGLILAMLVNMFLQNSMVDMVTSAVGVLLFSALTAYDAQKIKLLAQQLRVDEQTMDKVAIIGALTLYLDFVNLFLFLLNFMGNRRQD
ncbi:MAG: Bax inhibitor-1 family protein [Candidatus Babeliales bacterium]